MGEDDLAFGLPIVSEEALDEYVKRNEDRQYGFTLVDRLERENPQLFFAMLALPASSAEDRAGYLAVLMQTYALLAIQYELDMKIPKN